MGTRARRSMQGGPAAASAQAPAEHVADLLSCSICMEAYDDDVHQPKLLPCHHSYCKMCLVYLAANHCYIDCPSCRKRTMLAHLAPEGVLALQTNFYINQMRDLVSDGSKVKAKGCKKHGGKPFSHFCRSCELQICVECCTTDHREAAGHSTQDINRARLEQRHLLEVEIAEAQETILSAQPKISKLETEMCCLFAANNQTEEDIDASFRVYEEALKARKEKLKEDLRQLYRYKRQTLAENMERHNKQTTSLQGLLEHCQEAMDNGTVTDLIAYKTKLSSKNQEFRSDRIQAEPMENFLTFNSEDVQNEYLSMVHDLGSLNIHGPLPATVKVFDMPMIAGLYSNVSFEVRSLNGDPLTNYPITVDVIDSYDDIVPCLTQHRSSGRYEFTVRPMVSGLHRMKVLFLGHAIEGSGKNLNVLSNNPVALIGEKGFTDGDMEYPRAVAVNTDGSLYCIDTGNNRIQVFSSNGDFLFTFPISHESENFSSCGIAINHEQGTVVCPEVKMNEADMAKADTILIYTMEGRLLHRLSFQDTFSKALCIAVNSLGHMIVADFDLHTIFILDKQGRRLLRKFGEYGSGPGQFDHPTFVCVGDDDTIIVSDGDNHRIQVFDKAGTFLYKFGSKGSGKGEFNMPFGVATDNHGNILVVDGGNKRIQVFKTGGEFVFCIESLGDKMSAPRGIAVTSNGHVLVADRDNHCIKKFKYLHSTLL